MVKQTAGRDALHDFAPKFAELNDDVLFGEVWAREEALSACDRSIVTVTALMAGGILDSCRSSCARSSRSRRSSARASRTAPSPTTSRPRSKTA